MNSENFEHNHDYTLEEKVRGLIAELDAYIAHFHGGRVEFVSLDNDTLKVRMGGACKKCALQASTLKGWVEGTLQQFFPHIKHVENVK